MAPITQPGCSGPLPLRNLSVVNPRPITALRSPGVVAPLALRNLGVVTAHAIPGARVISVDVVPFLLVPPFQGVTDVQMG